jgi:hypothetical protein
MADVPTPTPPAPISGYRSRAINAAVDYTTAVRPIAGDGVTIADGVCGKTISVEPRGFAQRAAPWQVRAYPEPTSGTAVDWKVRVYGGLAIVNGGELAAPSEDGTDEATGLKWYEAPAFSQNAPWLCVEHDRYGNWFLSWHDIAVDLTEGEEYRAIAYLDDDGPPPRLIQFDVGVVDLGGGTEAAPLPFDLAIRGGYPCVYVPQNGENLVYVRGMGSEAVRDSSATPTPDQDGWRQLTPGTGPVWVWARWDHTTTGYLWGLSDTDPMQETDAQDRYLLSLMIGGFDGNDTAVTAQYYHGDIVVADDNGDDLSIDRDGYNDALCLHAVQVGAHTSNDWDDVDFVIREERSGDYPNAPYEVNYIAGATLQQAINSYVSTVIQTIIQGAITDLLTELINALGGSGSTVSDLVDALDARYQPICTSSTPAWGIGQGQWTTTPPSS